MSEGEGRVGLELELHGERGDALLLSSPVLGVVRFVGKSLVEAAPGVLATAREAIKRGEHPIILVSLPRWKAEAENLIAARDDRQGELL